MRAAIEGQRGIVRATTNPSRLELRVVYDAAATNPARVIAALEAAGYRARRPPARR